jgi:hypothetical protein
MCRWFFAKREFGRIVARHIGESYMRKLHVPLLFLAISAATIIALNCPASAETVPIAGTYSEHDIRDSCSRAGGRFTPSSNQTAGEYSCKTKKGEVNCNGNSCRGTCDTCGNPDIQKGKAGVLGILSGTTLKASAGTATKKSGTESSAAGLSPKPIVKKLGKPAEIDKGQGNKKK